MELDRASIVLERILSLLDNATTGHEQALQCITFYSSYDSCCQLPLCHEQCVLFDFNDEKLIIYYHTVEMCRTQWGAQCEHSHQSRQDLLDR